MDVNCHNFPTVLEEITHILKSCSHVSVAFNVNGPLPNDSKEWNIISRERSHFYDLCKVQIEKQNLVQLGLSFRSNDDRLSSKDYNFYLSPRSKKPVFVQHQQSKSFVQDDIDYNQWMCSSIPYTQSKQPFKLASAPEVDKNRTYLFEYTSESQSKGLTPDHSNAAVNKYTEIQEWVKSCTGPNETQFEVEAGATLPLVKKLFSSRHELSNRFFPLNYDKHLPHAANLNKYNHAYDSYLLKSKDVGAKVNLNSSLVLEVSCSDHPDPERVANVIKVSLIPVAVYLEQALAWMFPTAPVVHADVDPSQRLNAVWSLIEHAYVPLNICGGLPPIMQLYDAFYADLPGNFNEFATSFSEVFPQVYDVATVHLIDGLKNKKAVDLMANVVMCALPCIPAYVDTKYWVYNTCNQPAPSHKVNAGHIASAIGKYFDTCFYSFSTFINYVKTLGKRILVSPTTFDAAMRNRLVSEVEVYASPVDNSIAKEFFKNLLYIADKRVICYTDQLPMSVILNWVVPSTLNMWIGNNCTAYPIPYKVKYLRYPHALTFLLWTHDFRNGASQYANDIVKAYYLLTPLGDKKTSEGETVVANKAAPVAAAKAYVSQKKREKKKKKKSGNATHSEDEESDEEDINPESQAQRDKEFRHNLIVEKQGALFECVVNAFHTYMRANGPVHNAIMKGKLCNFFVWDHPALIYSPKNVANLKQLMTVLSHVTDDFNDDEASAFVLSKAMTYFIVSRAATSLLVDTIIYVAHRCSPQAVIAIYGTLIIDVLKQLQANPWKLSETRLTNFISRTLHVIHGIASSFINLGLMQPLDIFANEVAADALENLYHGKDRFKSLIYDGNSLGKVKAFGRESNLKAKKAIQLYFAYICLLIAPHTSPYNQFVEKYSAFTGIPSSQGHAYFDKSRDEIRKKPSGSSVHYLVRTKINTRVMKTLNISFIEDLDMDRFANLCNSNKRALFENKNAAATNNGPVTDNANTKATLTVHAKTKGSLADIPQQNVAKIPVSTPATVTAPPTAPTTAVVKTEDTYVPALATIDDYMSNLRGLGSMGSSVGLGNMGLFSSHGDRPSAFEIPPQFSFLSTETKSDSVFNTRRSEDRYLETIPSHGLPIFDIDEGYDMTHLDTYRMPISNNAPDNMFGASFSHIQANSGPIHTHTHTQTHTLKSKHDNYPGYPVPHTEKTVAIKKPTTESEYIREISRVLDKENSALLNEAMSGFVSGALGFCNGREDLEKIGLENLAMFYDYLDKSKYL